MSTAASSSQPIATRQFSLRALFSTMVTISMVLAYVRLFDATAVPLALGGLAWAVVCGGLIGWRAGRMVETLTWAIVGGALALICVLMAAEAERLPLITQGYWLALGVSGGLLAGVIEPGKWRLRLLAVVVQWICFTGISLLVSDSLGLVMLDAVVALPALAGLSLLAEVAADLQRRYRTALDLLAGSLILAVIMGNFGAILVWNWFYA
jgi:hypothetical protein